MERKDELLRIFARNIRAVLARLDTDFEDMQEIRLRVQGPLMVVRNNQQYFLTDMGKLVKQPETAHVVTADELRETLEYIGNHSLYAFEEEIRQGFITIQGGHRVGLAGKAVLNEGSIRTMKYISFINVRLAHQVKGCADRIMPYLRQGGRVYHTLIISPPKCGKTTLLRDMIRQLSDGIQPVDEENRMDENGKSGRTGVRRMGVTVGVVDERSELAACYQGIPQNDLGVRTDVLDCCPKAQGMMMLIRTMSPEVIAVDEIGGREDLEAMEYVVNCGCKILATVHGNSIEDVERKPILGKMVKARMFERYIILSNSGGVGTVEMVCDRDGHALYTGLTKHQRSTSGKGGSPICG